MKYLLTSLLLIFTIIALHAQSQVIKADSYLDVRTGKLISPANLLIEDGLIKSINPKSTPKSGEGLD